MRGRCQPTKGCLTVDRQLASSVPPAQRTLLSQLIRNQSSSVQPVILAVITEFSLTALRVSGRARRRYQKVVISESCFAEVCVASPRLILRIIIWPPSAASLFQKSKDFSAPALRKGNPIRRNVGEESRRRDHERGASHPALQPSRPKFQIPDRGRARPDHNQKKFGPETPKRAAKSPVPTQKL